MTIIIETPRRFGVDRSREVLCEALEAHVEGLKEAQEHATVDPNIEDAGTLVDITRSMSDDIEIGNSLLEVLRAGRTG